MRAPDLCSYHPLSGGPRDPESDPRSHCRAEWSPYPLPTSPRDPGVSDHLIANEDNSAHNQGQRKGCGRSMPVVLGQSRIPQLSGFAWNPGVSRMWDSGEMQVPWAHKTSGSPCFQYLTLWIRVLRDCAFVHVSSIFLCESADCVHSVCVSEPDCVCISAWCVCVLGDVFRGSEPPCL